MWQLAAFSIHAARIARFTAFCRFFPRYLPLHIAGPRIDPASLPRTPGAQVVGYLPITALSVYLGTSLEDLSLADPRIWIAVVALLALLLLARRLKPLIEGD